MNFAEVDRDTNSPPYEQIANRVRNAIVSGELRSGDRLPTETHLAEQFGVARMTVRRGLQQLRYEGIVIPASGRGLRVRPAPHPAAGLRWDQGPRYSTQLTNPGLNAGGDAARLIAQAESIRMRLCILAEDIRAAGPITDPVVLAHLLTILADIAAKADVLSALAACLHQTPRESLREAKTSEE